MKKLGMVFIFLGALLMGLSGLEKVLIFSSFNGDLHQMQAIKNFTPPYIWSITNFTFGFGLISFILGLTLFFNEYIIPNAK
ncbi:hypothetical protein ACTWP4_19510 [Gracilibacillus sp. D59]|uniref:hypothetical protein n=1 Tax=Gracilibacillus sp. D59 TaxID=3457434 RepID=UPI003FCE0AFB